MSLQEAVDTVNRLNDHKCRHAWETHTDSDPVAAGLHVEQFQQCLKCGEIR